MSMETYPVVLLVEQALSAADAAQVRSLHEELVEEGQQVSYHVLLPIHDAAARIEAAMGSLAGGELLTSPAVTMSDHRTGRGASARPPGGRGARSASDEPRDQRSARQNS